MQRRKGSTANGAVAPQELNLLDLWWLRGYSTSQSYRQFAGLLALPAPCPAASAKQGASYLGSSAAHFIGKSDCPLASHATDNYPAGRLSRWLENAMTEDTWGQEQPNVKPLPVSYHFIHGMRQSRRRHCIMSAALCRQLPMLCWELHVSSSGLGRIVIH